MCEIHCALYITNLTIHLAPKKNRINGTSLNFKFQTLLANTNTRCSRAQGIATAHWRKTEQKKLHATYDQIRNEIATENPGSEKLFTTHSVTISMFKSSDEAVEQLLIWQEWRAAWIYRIRPTRLTPRNYPLPKLFKQTGNAFTSPKYMPGAGTQRPRLVGPIDVDSDGEGSRKTPIQTTEIMGTIPMRANPNLWHIPQVRTHPKLLPVGKFPKIVQWRLKLRRLTYPDGIPLHHPSQGGLSVNKCLIFGRVLSFVHHS